MSSSTASQQHDMLLRRVERERNARIAAESILEEKSRELYDANVELLRTAENLQEQMQKYQSVFEFAAQGIVTVDSNWKIKSLNPAAEQIFALPETRGVGVAFQSLFSDSNLAPALSDFDTHQPGHYQMVGVRNDGSTFAADVTTSLIQHKEESVLVALIRDRTEQQQLETQLRHAQKMESVGQLAAGIAHEINTPIQFVSDNLRFLTDSFEQLEQLFEVVSKYDQLPQEHETLDELQQIRQDLESAIGLDFIRREIPDALGQSMVGIDRVTTIVHAMREFSHPGAAIASAVDINRGLQSTINVTRNEWKYIAAVTTDFDQNLPQIAGYPGDLNQAFLNIIVNAAHAIEANSDNHSELGQIHITTRRCADDVEITFTDNGCGIPESSYERVFEPFYTTKQVGKGTGQGLAVVHALIVEKHRGEINIESELDVGTKLTIRLPIRSIDIN